MKRLAVLWALAGVLAAGPVAAVSVGIGAFGGLSIPVQQDDNEQGSIFGVRVPVEILPLLTIEPYYASTSGGEVEETFGSITTTRSGIDVSAFGANVLLNFGTGLKFTPFAGIGSFQMERPGLDRSGSAWTAGLGIGFSPPLVGLSIDVRGELAGALEDDDESTRKWANVTVGVSYALFKFPPVP